MKKLIILFVIVGCAGLMAQEPYRVGTTAANFLEVGVGAAGNAMGDASVAVTSDLMSVYWNPAGLAFMDRSEAHFIQQPYIADINMQFAGVGLVLPNIATLAMAVTHMGYGDNMPVTTLEYPEGTGEKFGVDDYAFTLSIGRKLVQWFSFGVSGKFVSSQIWHCKANAMAVDLGAVVNTSFFSFSGQREDGMRIGMSISNYGTSMSYDGIDLLSSIDISPNEDGNYADVSGKFNPSAWELPLIFRLGIGLRHSFGSRHTLVLAVDALHPNNNSEYLNAGAEYLMKLPGMGNFFLRGGYKGIGMAESIFGPTFGAGFVLTPMPSIALKFDFAYRSMTLLGNAYTYGFGVMF
ncbi:PorV/PorQ family protein [bacterium]|nr:PorV/PorQ family protein [bacterium]